MIHLGGNDLATLGRRRILGDMTQGLEEVAALLRPAEIIWSELVPHFKWRGAEVHSDVENARRKLNFTMKKTCGDMGLGFIRHGLITLKTPEYYERDGFLLSVVGLAMFMLDISGALELAGCT